MQQVRRLMDEASLAVEYVFLFTLGAAWWCCWRRCNPPRRARFEAAVLRALGASRRRVRAAAMTEYAALGFASVSWARWPRHWWPGSWHRRPSTCPIPWIGGCGDRIIVGTAIVTSVA